MEKSCSKKAFIEKIVAAAGKNEDLKKELIKDPKGFIEKKIKFKIPENLKITVLEEKSDEIYIVLPVDHDTVKKELNEEELSEVAAGGVCWNDACSCSACCGP